MDIRGHLDQFSERIRDSERPIGFLLGAGCGKSVLEDGDPLIPDTVGMTRAIADIIRDEGREETWNTILEIGGFDNDDQINVEEILSLVRELRPHVGDGEIRGLSEDDFGYLEETIREEIVRLVDVVIPDTPNSYQKLTRWVALTERDHPVEIFTTNYDLLVEKSFEENEVPFFDGFIGGHQPFFDSHTVLNENLPSRWARVWKLHGSINWNSRDVDGTTKILKSSGGVDKDRAVIHPSHLKYDQSRKMPYRAFSDRLSQFLEKSESVLFVVGYSFGDQHLNEVILESLQGQTTSQVFALLYSDLEKYEHVRDLALRESDLNVFAEDAGVVGTNIYEWDTISSDSVPDSEDTIGIDWKESEEGFRQISTLGDFEEFGKLLESVIGR